MMDAFTSRIQTVGEVTRSLKGLLETSYPFITVVGEISNLRRPHSGHFYFTLKDAEAQLRAVLFKTQQRYLNETLREGMEVVCRGRISLYESRGEYQLIVDVVDGRGEGALRLAFDELKQRLAAEGIFELARKRPLPFLPCRIGVITSPEGAALHDFLHMAAARFPGLPIEIYPVRVQGEGAVSEIVEALAGCNERRVVDVIVLCRGGGSIEDLWAFNEESVARAIYASEIPVVSAVGHEVDYTIADFVADKRAPTPTAAAELVMPDREALLGRLQDRRLRLQTAMERLLGGRRQRVAYVRRTLADPSVLLARQSLRLEQRQHRILQCLQDRLRLDRRRLDGLTIRLLEQNPRERLLFQKRWVVELSRKTAMLTRMLVDRKVVRMQRAVALLDAVSPLAVLGRGYAIARIGTGGEVLRDSEQVRVGDGVEVLLQSGVLDCQVTGKRDAE
ncbi:MAG: exodeoxyribonuclease VII large subunit [Desulfobulbaceae bacterium]|nr:exodeoxyribonuclease VII large subunit [Desulfobulbaceae bacterium]